MASQLVNKTTGKAVADIKALAFYKHVNGVEPIVSAELLSSTDWFTVLTLKDSVNINQDAPSVEKINVDQFDAAIGMTTEPGDYTFEALLPSLMKADMEKWLGGAIKEVEGAVVDGKQLIGFDLGSELHQMSVMVQARTGETFLYPRVLVSLSFTKEGKVFTFRANGQVVAPTQSENKMMYMATEAPASAG